MITVATANTPRKGFLLSPFKQARALVNLWKAKGVDVCACQEVYTRLRTAMRFKRAYIFWSARHNNVLRKTAIGNSVAIRRTHPWNILSLRTLHAEMPGRRRGLNFPVATIERDGMQITIIAVHLPTRRAAPEATWKTIAGIIRGAALTSKHVIVLGDFNRNAQQVRDAFGGLKIVASHNVDHILVRGLELDYASEASLGKISDHGAMVIARLKKEN